jgi:hypothetical protein
MQRRSPVGLSDVTPVADDDDDLSIFVKKKATQAVFQISFCYFHNLFCTTI